MQKHDQIVMSRHKPAAQTMKIGRYRSLCLDKVMVGHGLCLCSFMQHAIDGFGYVKRIRADTRSPAARSHSVSVAEIPPIKDVGKVVPRCFVR